MVSVALRAVPQPGFYEEEVRLPFDGEGHSLHSAVPYLNAIPSEVAAYLVREFSKPKEVVFDPFCGSGTILLEAALQGRMITGCDLDPLAVSIARSKLRPADLSRVAFSLQGLDLSLPVDVTVYENHFEPFYDLSTFREIFHFRSSLLRKTDFVSDFLKLLMQSVLHGHTSSHLSAYTFPHVALSPEEQRQLNYRRNSYPHHREVQARVLKRAAQVLRDGLPSRITRREGGLPHIARADARNISFLQSEEVDSIITAFPECHEGSDRHVKQWLRCWFAGIRRSSRDHLCAPLGQEEWLDFANEYLCESARLVRRGGRQLLVFKGGNQDQLVENFRELIDGNLSSFWHPEGALNLSREKRLTRTHFVDKTVNSYTCLVLRRL